MLTAVGDFTFVATGHLGAGNRIHEPVKLSLCCLGGRKGWIGVAGELLLTSVSFRT